MVRSLADKTPPNVNNLEHWIQSLESENRGKDESSVDVELIRHAFTFRQSEVSTDDEAGTILASLEVANILRDLKVDNETLVAGILHDSSITGQQRIEKIKQNFGEAIAGLVAGVARMDIMPAAEKNLQTGQSSQIDGENLRRMLLAMVEDVRVVLIKLADRLLLLRHLKNSPAEQQRKIAAQTQEIFSPLANRLGIWQLKWQLEDLSLRYLKPDEYHRIAASLDERRADREVYIEQFMQKLEDELNKVGIQAEISGRVKHINSIYRKMMRKNVDIDQIFDVRAVRILVDTIPDCYAALGVAHSLWPYIKEEFDDYITTPKNNNYQSIHTAVRGPEGKLVEIQIRTHAMHERGELGVAAHWRYKEGVGHDESFDRKIAWLRQLLEWKDEAADGSDFVAEFRSQVFEDRVYVFTPAGKIIDLPSGSTPLDFAYSIHTEIGHRCRGARVNGAIAQLTYQLKTGDKVEILTIKEGQPSRDWINPHLGYTRSHRAKSKIQQWFRHQEYDQNAADGRTILDKELLRLGLKDVNIDKLSQRLKFNKTSDMMAAVGRSEVKITQIANALQGFLSPQTKKEPELKLRQQPAKKNRSDIHVLGVGNLMTHMAQCCKPVPGDDIVGYITQGRGVSIHRSDCSNVLRARNQEDKHLIEVNWGGPEQDIYTVDIQIVAYDRKGLLHDITALLSNEKTNVTAVSTKSNSRTNEATMKLTIEVENLSRLSQLLSRINELPNVYEARRITE
ncbi:GTP pyrophosphokinase [bacterium BMS3Abin11]|nr:GTP pyrophosphokinase [bacterium BMS3Abin11]GMT40290.1 MAG: GTP pyrophosphokinase [bacterium]HDZ77796.1 GTP diphosphokinase [Gammaproteobacteria bacterium]